MSFDDGPSQGSRAVNALSLCDSLPVDVFIIGRNAGLTERSRALLGAYRENPFVEIGNHSYSHANHHYDKFFRDADTVLIDVNRSRDFLHLNNGLVRLPGRNFFRLGKARRNDRNNGKEAADKLADNGYRVFGWDLEWRRISSSGISVHSAAEMLEIVTSMLDDGKTFLPNQIVLLLHDRDLRDARFELQVREFVRLARAEGRYRFAHLGEMRSDDSP